MFTLLLTLIYLLNLYSFHYALQLIQRSITNVSRKEQHHKETEPAQAEQGPTAIGYGQKHTIESESKMLRQSYT